MKKLLIASVALNIILVLTIGLLYYFAVPYCPFNNLSFDDIKSITAYEDGTNKKLTVMNSQYMVEIVLQYIELYRGATRAYEPVEGEKRHIIVIELNDGKLIEFGGGLEFVDGSWYFLMNGKQYKTNGFVELSTFTY